MVDEPRVAALLQRIEDEVGALERSAARPDDELAEDVDALPAMKYRFIVAIEAATDVADHVIASEGLRPSTSFADSFTSLREAGWLQDDLSDRLADAARFRNLLVHQYAEVDDARLVEIARTRLVDLRDFVRAIARRVLATG